MIAHPRVRGRPLHAVIAGSTFGQLNGARPCLDLPLYTNIIAMASVDNVDVVIRLTSSIHHDVNVMLGPNDKTTQHISHSINSCFYWTPNLWKYTGSCSNYHDTPVPKGISVSHTLKMYTWFYLCLFTRVFCNNVHNSEVTSTSFSMWYWQKG